MKDIFQKIKSSVPVSPYIVIPGLILPAGTLILFGAAMWNYYKNRNN